MPATNAVEVAPAVAQAIASGSAVVALESAVITHGLPQKAALEAVRRQSDACERAGALPAIVGVYERALRVGLSFEECSTLAANREAVKVSPWNLAASMLSPGFGGTTVAATIVAAETAGIRVVSTGGIGGVHPGGGEDISADLVELSRRPVAVICAGPKSTLDTRATLERLETLGVPVIGWRSSLLAGFLDVSTGLRLTARADTIDTLASIAQTHWDLGGAGLVVSQPVSQSLAIDRADLADDGSLSVRGPQRTPAELGRLQARLGDRVIETNIALLESNAALAASLAVALRRSPAGAARE